MRDGFPHSVAVVLGLLLAFGVSLFFLAAMADINSALIGGAHSKAASTLWGESQRLCLRPRTCGFRLARRAFRPVKNNTTSGVFVATHPRSTIGAPNVCALGRPYSRG